MNTTLVVAIAATIVIAGAIAATIVITVLAILLIRTRKAASDLRHRFAAVLDVDREVASVRDSAKQEQEEAERALAAVRSEIESLRKQYSVGRSRFEELQRAVNSLEENLESIDVGLYRPHFTYSDSESYKATIEAVRARQRSLIKSGRAAVCGTSWTVGGSRREGERMVKQTQRLILRAFNAESEAAVANVTWKNHHIMAARIAKAFEMLNNLGTVLQVNLTTEYRQLRLEELRLVFEAAEKKQQEQEEQRRQRAEQREEERAQRELLREQEEAAREEARYQKMLEKARHDLEGTRDAEREAMAERIRQLEADLAAARDRKERAIAQAQLTRVGHVYIISNVGAFGEGVLKIGLTRRLEPEERIRELSDASVPFPFDIHAMIYSEDAPDLETRLQKRFWERRLNWANDRKEFFHVSLGEVQEELRDLGLPTEILTLPEAKEYRQTLSALEEKALAEHVRTRSSELRFPEDPFVHSPAVETSADQTAT